MFFQVSRLIVLVLAGCALLQACAASDDAPTPQNDMTVDVNFLEIHRCSRISPEIRVANAPQGTKYYDIRLLEEGQQDRFLGGGTWPEDGSGLIPEGALTKHYTGPCPPKDKAVEFVYVVSAMDNEQGQPLAVRLYRFKPE